MKNIIYQYMIADERTDARGIIPEIPNRKRSDVYRQVAQLSAKSFSDYAKHIGAQHHYSTKGWMVDKYPDYNGHTVMFEVLRIIYDPIFEKFDNVLFVDTDIICNTRENIFEVFSDESDVAGVLESDIMSGDGEYRYNSWDKTWEGETKAYDKLCKKYLANGVEPTPTTPGVNSVMPSKIFMMNTGVMVWSHEARLRARYTWDDWFAWYVEGIQTKTEFWVNNDQPYISGQLMKHNFAIQNLEQTWNDSPPHYKSWDDWRDKNFLHYTGGFGKKYLLDDLAARRFKYI